MSRGSDPAYAEQDSISMTISDNVLPLQLYPGVFEESEKSYINIATTNSTGYSFSVSSASQTSMVSDEQNEIIAIDSPLTENEFSTNALYQNKWGIKPSHYVSDGATLTNTNYRPPPSTEGELFAVTNTPNTESDTYTISFGSIINENMPLGIYRYNYNLIAVVNPILYSITYDGNNSDDVYNLPAQQNISIQEVTLDAKTPVTDKWVFLGWCDEATVSDTCGGTLYQPGDTYMVDPDIVDPNIILYATWREEPALELAYNYGENINFDGRNYLDTGLKLFSAENVNKDVKVSTGIANFLPLQGQDQGMNVVFSDMNELGAPYPGFNFRYILNTEQYEVSRNNERYATENIYLDSAGVNYVSFSRKNHILYYKTNTNSGGEAIDYANVPTFDNNLTFGASLNKNGQPFRYFRGNLTNPTISFINRSIDTFTTILPTPTFGDKVFAGWYDTPEYTEKVGDGGDGLTITEDATLYAKWEDESPDADSYSYDGEILFDGTNYINTGVKLYSTKNINKNYEIAFTIVNYAADNESLATIMNSLNEFDHKYPGILMRINTENTSKTDLTSATNGVRKNKNFDGYTGEIKIYRVNDTIYYKVEDGPVTMLGTVDPETDWSNVPVTFGASLDENNDPFRNFKGTLADLSVKYLPDDYSLDDLEEPTKATQLIYSHPEAKVFAGPCTPSSTDDCTDPDAEKGYLDTGIYLFNQANITKDFTISFEIDSIDPNNDNQAVFVNTMNEAGSPWPGIVFRYSVGGGDKLELVVNKSTGSDGSAKRYYSKDTTTKIKIMRKNGIIYVKTNEIGEDKLIDMSGFASYFDVPVTFGAGLDGSGNPFRYFHGTLSNMEILIEPDP